MAVKASMMGGATQALAGPRMRASSAGCHGGITRSRTAFVTGAGATASPWPVLVLVTSRNTSQEPFRGERGGPCPYETHDSCRGGSPPARLRPSARTARTTGGLAEVRRLEVEFSNADAACEKEHIVPVEDRVRAEKGGSSAKQTASCCAELSHSAAATVKVDPLRKPLAASILTPGVVLTVAAGGSDEQAAGTPWGGGRVEDQLGFGRLDFPDARVKAENAVHTKRERRSPVGPPFAPLSASPHPPEPSFRR